MKILDLQTGSIHEYGTSGHDSLYVSTDGRYLTYYNLQNGDGSGVGDYRFVCDDDKVPAESETADARYCEVYFNIGGWHEPRWIPVSEGLPNLWAVVLVTDESGNVFEYERRPLDENGNEYNEWCFLGRKIIAWQPLPEPYEPKEKENG